MECAGTIDDARRIIRLEHPGRGRDGVVNPCPSFTGRADPMERLGLFFDGDHTAGALVLAQAQVEESEQLIRLRRSVTRLRRDRGVEELTGSEKRKTEKLKRQRPTARFIVIGYSLFENEPLKAYSKGTPDSSARSCKLTCRFVPPVACCLRTFISALVKYRA